MEKIDFASDLKNRAADTDFKTASAEEKRAKAASEGIRAQGDVAAKVIRAATPPMATPGAAAGSGGPFRDE
jgi:hypothetical protein